MPKASVVHILYKTAQALGPKRCEILKLYFEQGLEPDQVKLALGVNDQDYLALVQHPLFVKEYEKQNRFFLNSSKQLRLKEKQNKRKNASNVLSVNERLEKLSPLALDALEAQMLSSPSEAIKQKAAIEILDRAGYVKVEKRVSLQVSAEEVIKELNRQNSDVLDATVIEVGKIDGPAASITQ
jgi:hypothetical protein